MTVTFTYKVYIVVCEPSWINSISANITYKIRSDLHLSPSKDGLTEQDWIMQAGEIRCIPEVNLFNSSNLHQSVSGASFQISTDSSVLQARVHRSWFMCRDPDRLKGSLCFIGILNGNINFEILSPPLCTTLQKRISSFLQIRFVLFFPGIYRELCLESVKNKYECEIQAACQHWEVRGQVQIHLVQKQRILHLFSFFWSCKYVCNLTFLRCFA